MPQNVWHKIQVSAGCLASLKAQPAATLWFPQPWPVVVAVRKVLQYLHTSQGLLHLSAARTNTLILIGRHLATGCDASHMSNHERPTVKQRHYFEIVFFEKSKQQQNKNNLSYRLERQTVPPPTLCNCLYFSLGKQIRDVLQKMNIFFFKAIFSAKTS